MKKYRYSYEKVEMGGGGWSPLGGFGLSAERYREVIDRRAKPRKRDRKKEDVYDVF